MNIIRQFVKKAIPAVIPPKLYLVHGAVSHFDSQAHANCYTADTRPLKEIAFTFDDGPHPEYTPLLLDVLQKYQQQATFFVIGEKARQYPHLIERIVQEGHELGNHTLTHSEPAQTSTRDFLEEIEQTDQILEQITGKTVKLVRPPKGKLNLGKLLGLWRQRRTVVLWDIDPRDYLMNDQSEMIDWCQNYHPVSGNFCLMHDNHPYAIEAVRQLSECQHTRLQSHTVSHWIENKTQHSTRTQQACA
ncbi:polysaccharide deacetylase family protein [Gimesia maris]|uniref:polysaccharide deacetylase family protein n=1 Tax=Gimesia maris TaxID=122 RepID=UPI00241F5E0B|nr:polysaccharide deacetylase family protein [Gimesia maris]|tara:strand:- start:140188 stop:140925 length:738 start_codon:yes stop_codon:yes gene_type:complete